MLWKIEAPRGSARGRRLAVVGALFLVSDIGYSFLLAVPVFVDGRAWGAIDLESEEADAFDADDARVVRAAAAQLGSALARLSAERSGQPAPSS